MKQAELAIHRLRELPENWDSYGAPKVTDEARSQALECLREIERRVESLPDPIVGPDVGGGIELIWENPAKRIHLHLLIPPHKTYTEYTIVIRLEGRVVSTETVKGYGDVAYWIHHAFSPR